MSNLLLFIDTETTGIVKGHPKPTLEPGKWPRLVEIAWILTDISGTTVECDDLLIIPDGFSIPPESTKIHNITTDIAKNDGIPVKEALERFIQVSYQADTVVAHNLWFDFGVIIAEGTRLGLNPFPPEIQQVCTMHSSTDHCKLKSPKGKGYKWPGLAELYKILFNKDIVIQHRAINDTKVCMSCYFELVKLGVISQ